MKKNLRTLSDCGATATDDGPMPTIILKVHIRHLKRGDKVLHKGKERWIGPKDIKEVDGIRTIFGDSYENGSKPVQKIVPTASDLMDPIALKAFRRYEGPKLSTEELTQFVELRRNGSSWKLVWRARDPYNHLFESKNIPSRYARSCTLFNKRFAGKEVEGDTFVCCGVQYKTAEVIDAIRNIANISVKYIGPIAHLHGKGAIAKASGMGWLLQFDSLSASYGGVKLGWGWHYFAAKYVKVI